MAAIAGVNKCGKTRLLKTILPAYIRKNTTDVPIMIYVDCGNLFGRDTGEDTCKAVYQILASELLYYYVEVGIYLITLPVSFVFDSLQSQRAPPQIGE